MTRVRLFVAALVVACSSEAVSTPKTHSHSGTIASSADGTRLFVVNTDADSISVVDIASKTLVREVQLAGTTPSVDSATGNYFPDVMPRALTVNANGTAIYATGQRSGALYAIDTASFRVRASAPLCSEPIGVVASSDDHRVYVACSQDDAILGIDPGTLSVVETVHVGRKPWALSWSADGKSLFASHLLGPGITVLTPGPLAVASTWAVPDIGPRGDPTEPHGAVRGLYDVAPRPNSDEIWVPHLLLGIDTPQPSLAFNNTAFPAIAVLQKDGTPLARLSVQGANVTAPTDGGAFGDIVSGPHAIAFSQDGSLGFMVDRSSEDVLVVDASTRFEVGLLRPLPGHLPEGAVVVGNTLFIHERNTRDIAVFHFARAANGGVSFEQQGQPISTTQSDPMPATLRDGQKLFFSANSDDVAITQNHWVACATCHIEGRSDAVTWLFEQGPRDTPTNAGGMLDTGFLFRTAARSRVQDYWKTIDVEQGGFFHPQGAQAALLDDLAAFVNHALPVPTPPRVDQSLWERGRNVFNHVGCLNCHNGPARTDSGSGNASLDLNGSIVLHDVNTCVTQGPWPDVSHLAIDGQPRAACAFDTPALRGLWDSAPYLHDGSAKTLDDTLPSMLAASVGKGMAPPKLSNDDRAALVEYLKGL